MHSLDKKLKVNYEYLTQTIKLMIKSSIVKIFKEIDINNNLLD